MFSSRLSKQKVYWLKTNSKIYLFKSRTSWEKNRPRTTSQHCKGIKQSIPRPINSRAQPLYEQGFPKHDYHETRKFPARHVASSGIFANKDTHAC